MLRIIDSGKSPQAASAKGARRSEVALFGSAVVEVCAGAAKCGALYVTWVTGVTLYYAPFGLYYYLTEGTPVPGRLIYGKPKYRAPKQNPALTKRLMELENEHRKKQVQNVRPFNPRRDWVLDECDCDSETADSQQLDGTKELLRKEESVYAKIGAVATGGPVPGSHGSRSGATLCSR